MRAASSREKPGAPDGECGKRSGRSGVSAAAAAWSTVQTVLRIMEDKGLVERRTEGRTFIYAPTHSRERVASRFLNKVFDGALDQFVLTILQGKDASPGELEELERLIAKARREK